VILGFIVTYFIMRRRWLFIFIVPAYYFLFQSIIHNEFRYILPMYYFLFIFSAVSWCLLAQIGAPMVGKLFNARISR
jgi:hypothetical protein